MSERKLFDIAQRWTRLILSLRRRGSGRFYIGFARFGVFLSLAGMAPWFPSVKQQLLDWLVKRALEQVGQQVGNGTAAEPNLFAWQVGISLTCFLAGISIVTLSLLLFDRSVRSKGPGEENNDAISIRVQEGTTLEALTTSTADKFGATVKLDEIPRDFAELIVSAGPLRAPSFPEFLDQVSARTTPPRQVIWSEEGDQFFVAKSEAFTVSTDAQNAPAK